MPRNSDADPTADLHNFIQRKRKEEQSDHHHDRRQFNYARLFAQLHPKSIATTLIGFCAGVPHFLWSFFIEAFLIPSYRPEWSFYSLWQVNPAGDSDTEVGMFTHHKKSRKRQKRIRLSSVAPKPVRHNHEMCQIITINVAGKIYQTQLRTLAFYPDTLLGDPNRRQKLYDPSRNDYFIDRNRICFDAILYYYQSRGILRRPFTVSLEMFEEEIRFFDLGQEVIDKLRREEGILMDMEKIVPRKMLQRKYWLLFEYPESSMQARVVAILSITVVLISIFTFCLETMPDFQKNDDDHEPVTLQEEIISMNDPFFFTETICIAWFVFEFIVRAITCPRKSVFFKSMSNIIDLLAILPYFVHLFMAYQHSDDETNKNMNKATSLTIFRVIRLVRVFRILKLSRHNRGLKVLGKTLRASIRELALLLFFLVIGVVLFSSGVYFTELHHDHTHYPSILDAFWWSIITMTTCGFGDDVPHTVWGKIVGAVCAISGVLTLALPVPVIVSNFNNFYSRDDDTSTAHAESNHVPQCPCRSGWYDNDGSILGDRQANHIAAANMNFKMLGWMAGENKPDDSDSDFDSLRHIDYDNNAFVCYRIRRLTHLKEIKASFSRKSMHLPASSSVSSDHDISRKGSHKP